MIEQIFSPELIQALGWTLVHTLWQAALFALLLGLALLLLRKYSARTRYVTAIGVLAAFCLTTLLTFSQLYVGEGPVASTETTTTSTVENSEVMAMEPTPANADRSAVSPSANRKTSMVSTASNGPGFRERVISYYNEHLPLIVTLWLMGVLILQLRFLGQLAFLQRLKNYGTERFPARFAPMLQELESKLGITKPVRYLTSFRVGSPFTAGWLRPAVLFPRGLLGELDEAQLRTIIAHELAHIKRYDFLVNLIQTLLCILFFYHPAAWWISARIDEEREHCCDDLAIEVTGEAIGYARTLLQLKENELAGSPLAMGVLGKGDGFKERITRLLSGYLGTGTYGEGFTTAVILFCFMGLAVTLSAQDRTDMAERENTASVTSSAPASARPTELAEVPENLTAQEIRQLEILDEIKAMRPSETEDSKAYDEWKKQAGTVPLSDSLEFPFLMEAIKEGSESMVAYFLKKDIDFNQTNNNGLTPLALAAGENRVDIIRLLIRKGADVNYVSNRGWTALIEAADEGALDAAKELLDAGAKTDLPGTSRSAADMAASEGHPEILALLSRNGADISGKGRETSPLHQAAEEGQFFVVQSLIQAGADAGAKDASGRTALSYAAEEGHGGVATLLAGQGHVNVADHDGRTPISYAAEEGHDDIVNILQIMGGLVISNDNNGATPLHYAADEGLEGVVSKLLKEGAEVNAKDNRRMTALHYAAAEGNVAVVGHLLAAGADVKAKDITGYTALDYALDEMLDMLDDELANLGPGMTFNDQTGYPRDESVTLVWDLLEAGATSDRIHPQKKWIRSSDGRVGFPYILDRDAKTYRGGDGVQVGNRSVQIPAEALSNRSGSFDQKMTERLVRAIDDDDTDNYDDLLAAGADINGNSANGYTPLTMASHENHNIDTDRLLRAGADINKTDNRGHTPLTEAAKEGHQSTVRTLLERGAKPDLADRKGNTAKDYALREGFVNILRLLNDAGASVTALDEEGNSPLSLPAREGDAATVRYLLEQGVDPDASRDCHPVFLAAREGHPAVIRLLAEKDADLEAGCDYRDTDFFGREMAGFEGTLALYRTTSPLMVALTESDGASAKVLLTAGADVNQSCRKIRFALRQMPDKWIELENLSEDELHQKHKFIYEASNWTPLMEAAESGKLSLVQLLLKAGADKRQKTKEGMSAYDVAVAGGFREMAALLK